MEILRPKISWIIMNDTDCRTIRAKERIAISIAALQFVHYCILINIIAIATISFLKDLNGHSDRLINQPILSRLKWRNNWRYLDKKIVNHYE